VSDRRSTTTLLPFVLLSFAANSLITRHVVGDDLLDPGLLTCVRFISGALALLALTLALGDRPVVGRANLLPALWLGVYAACISYGYQHIGAAPGTFVFYATVLVTLVAVDVLRGVSVPPRRLAGAGVALAGVGVLASGAVDTVTPLGVALLAATGAAWGLYTAAGRTSADPRVASTGHFTVLALALLPWTALLLSPAADSRVTASGVVWGGLMGAGTTSMAYVAWYACQRTLSATSAGTAQLAIPVLTAFGAVLLLDEAITARLVLAAVLVAAGLTLAATSSRRDPHLLGPGRAPTPFTAEEIRRRSTEGRVKHIRVESADEPAYVRSVRFVDCDAEGATVERTRLDHDGAPTGALERHRVAWSDLQAHASFPAEQTEIAQERIEIPIGVLDCLRYTVTDGESVDTFWFAKDAPGMPVRYTSAVAGQVVSTTTVIFDDITG
jgi:drug/metabolite transporter (DMT)-like permease